MFGITTWKASDALAPCAAGSVSRSTTFICSMNEPGHPWQRISGNASACWERTWTKWMSRSSISVMTAVRLQARLALAPGVLVVPVARDLLDQRERHALATDH